MDNKDIYDDEDEDSIDAESLFGSLNGSQYGSELEIGSDEQGNDIAFVQEIQNDESDEDTLFRIILLFFKT